MTHGNSAYLLLIISLTLSGCGTISTFQTGKTTPQGKLNFGIGSSGGLLRTKSKIIGFPIELGYAAVEAQAAYGFLDFLEAGAKGMVTGTTDEGGLPLYGGGWGRFALAQERWGFPLSVAGGYALYTGRVQAKQTNLQGEETKKDVTRLTDAIYFINISKDITPWLTLYGVGKIYKRSTKNFRFENKILKSEEDFRDDLQGGGGGVSLNVGPTHNTHIMIEYNEIRDKDEPQKHYQKQAGLGMSVDF